MPRPSAALPALLVLALVVAACAGPAQSVEPRPTTTPRPTPAPTLDATRLLGTVAWSTDQGLAGAPQPNSDDVFVAPLDQRLADGTSLTSGAAREFDPDLSPDGSRIVYRANPDPASDHADIWLVNADGSAARNLTGNAEQDNWSPAWAPDGARIAFASTRDGGTLSVWTMAVDGSDLQRVTAGHGEYPDWSPDGRRIVYAAPPPGSGRYDLWIAPADGSGQPVRVTDAPGTEFAPAWSPDGEWIAYQVDAADHWQLWLVRPDGSEAHQVSPEGEDGVWAAWSPDGLLAWVGTRGVSVLDVDTGATSVMAGAPPSVGFISWSR